MMRSEQEKRAALLETFIEVAPLNNDQFLQVKETLSRIGIANKSTKTLTQTCFVLHKQGRYFIVHFLELFALDGKGSDLNEDDIARRNAIASMLHSWGMCKILKGCDPSSKHTSNFFVLKHSEKTSWELVTKYAIGGGKVNGKN